MVALDFSQQQKSLLGKQLPPLNFHYSPWVPSPLSSVLLVFSNLFAKQNRERDTGREQNESVRESKKKKKNKKMIEHV